ncbi:MAG: hypothetical protein ACOVLC_05085 [Flavobacterium sp.]
MGYIEKDEKGHQKPEQTKEKEPISFGSRTLNFLKAHLLSVVLLLLLIVGYAWFSVEKTAQKKQFIQEKSALILEQANTIDSLKMNHLKFATEVFSWSVRSELMRENTENLSQLLTVFVKDSGADLVQLIDPKNQKILLSSDKKFEGNQSSENNLAEINNTVMIRNQNSFKILSPIMGFNDKIGVLKVVINAQKAPKNASYTNNFKD